MLRGGRVGQVGEGFSCKIPPFSACFSTYLPRRDALGSASTLGPTRRAV